MNSFWGELNTTWRWVVGIFIALYTTGTVFAFTYLIYDLWNDAPIIIYSMSGVTILFIGFMYTVAQFYEWLYRDFDED